MLTSVSWSHSSSWSRDSDDGYEGGYPSDEDMLVLFEQTSVPLRNGSTTVAMKTDRADGLPDEYVVTHSGWGESGKYYALTYKGYGVGDGAGIDPGVEGGGYGGDEFTSYMRPRADFQTDELDLVSYEELWFDSKGKFHWYSATPETDRRSDGDPSGIPADSEYTGVSVRETVVAPTGKGKVSITGIGGGIMNAAYSEETGDFQANIGRDRITGSLERDRDGKVYFNYSLRDRISEDSLGLTARRYTSGDVDGDALLATGFASLDRLNLYAGSALGWFGAGVLEPLIESGKANAKKGLPGSKSRSALPIYFVEEQTQRYSYQPNSSTSSSGNSSLRGAFRSDGLISSLRGDEYRESLDRDERYVASDEFNASFRYGSPDLPGAMAERFGLGGRFRGLMESMYGLAERVLSRYTTVRLPSWSQFDAGLQSPQASRALIGEVSLQGQVLSGGLALQAPIGESSQNPGVLPLLFADPLA
jgi:hypothetical protein